MTKEQFKEYVDKYDGDACEAIKEIAYEYNNGIKWHGDTYETYIDDWECWFAIYLFKENEK